MSAAAVIEYDQPTHFNEDLWTDLEKEPFTKVPNRFLNRIQHRLRPIQTAMMNHVFRQTIGFHRRSASISNTEFMRAAHASRRAILYAKKELIEMGLLLLVAPGKGFTKCRYAVNLYFDMDIASKKKVIMDMVQAANLDEPEPAPEPQQTLKGIKYREVEIKGLKAEHPGYNDPIQMPNPDTEKVYSPDFENEKTGEAAPKAEEFSVQQSPAAPLGIQPEGTPEANTQEKVYTNNPTKPETDEPNNHATPSPLAASDAASVGVQRPEFLKIVQGLKSNSPAAAADMDTPPENENAVKPIESGNAKNALSFKRVQVHGPLTYKDKQDPKVDTKRDKRKAIAAVCKFLIEILRMTLTGKEYAFINYCIREWGPALLVAKLQVMKRQHARGQEFKNPLGWLNQALRYDYQLSQNDKIKLRSDEASRKQAEAYRKKQQEERVKEDAEAAESAHFKAINAKMDPKAKAKLREDALKQIKEMGIKPDWITDALIISVENGILKKRADPDGNV